MLGVYFNIQIGAQVHMAANGTIPGPVRAFRLFPLPIGASSYRRNMALNRTSRNTSFPIDSCYYFFPSFFRVGYPMKSNHSSTTRWTTASLSSAADTSPMELFALGEHLNHCRGAHRRLFAMRCVAESVNGFISARIVTSMFIFAVLIGLVSVII